MLYQMNRGAVVCHSSFRRWQIHDIQESAGLFMLYSAILYSVREILTLRVQQTVLAEMTIYGH